MVKSKHMTKDALSEAEAIVNKVMDKNLPKPSRSRFDAFLKRVLPTIFPSAEESDAEIAKNMAEGLGESVLDMRPGQPMPEDLKLGDVKVTILPDGKVVEAQIRGIHHTLEDGKPKLAF